MNVRSRFPAHASAVSEHLEHIPFRLQASIHQKRAVAFGEWVLSHVLPPQAPSEGFGKNSAWARLIQKV